MESIQDFILSCREHSVYRYVLSAPVKGNAYEKTVVSRIEEKYQCEQYTKTQVFHRNLREDELTAYLQEQIGPCFTQVHAWDEVWEYALRISKKGKLLYNRTKTQKAPPVRMTHNRKKQYLLEEGIVIPPLVDMGVFTPEGKLLSSEDFAKQLKTVKNAGKSSACFLIGSSFGMAPRVKQRADFRLSMGPMTFPHHLARIMVLEQLYRAEAIQAGSKYHK